MTKFTSTAALVMLVACSAAEDEQLSPDRGHEGGAWDQAYEDELGKTDGECSGIRVPDRPGFEGRIALTFDDGPSLSVTPQVLDLLAERGIRATFFINGNKVTSAAHEALLDRMLNEGHLLANHSHSHQNMVSLSEAQAASEIEATDEIVRRHDPEARFFRFPFGSTDCARSAIAGAFGYTVVGWHADSADWCFASATGGVGFCSPSTFRHVPDAHRGDMVKYTMAQVRDADGGIVLFHDVHQHTAVALEVFLDTATAEGFTFVNIDDEGAFPKINDAVREPQWVGTACDPQDIDACDFHGNGQPGFCEPVSSAGAYCSLDCSGPCPDRPGFATTFCVSLDGGLTGNCVPQADPLNGHCVEIPGTRPTERARFVGSGTSSIVRTVCVP